MELIDKIVRIPDIDEFAAMRDVARKLCEAYMSLDFEPLIGLFAHDIVYISHVALTKFEGIDAVAEHFRTKERAIKQENEMVFAKPAKLITNLFQWEFIPVDKQAYYRHHHGEPVVVLGYLHNITRTSAIVRFTLDQDGRIATMVAYNQYCYRLWMAKEDNQTNADRYFEESVHMIANELISNGHSLHEIHYDLMPNLVTFKDERLYFTLVEAARVPFEPIFTQERIECYQEHCDYHQAIGMLAKVLLRMDNDKPWDIRFSQELKMDYVIEGFALDEAMVNRPTN